MEQSLLRFLFGGRRADADRAFQDDQFRAILSFRFRYIFTFHAPVLLPLLESLAGRIDPSIGMLSLGAASLTMVVAEVPAGVYADRQGPKRALAVGVGLMIAVMILFFVATLARASFFEPSAEAGYWVPGVVAMFCAEIAIGVALALINGADTVLFIDVARRAGLDPRSIEGIGASVRYFGTMIAVGSGATIYMLAEVLVGDPAARLMWQSSLYLLTAAAQVLALLALRRVDVTASRMRGWRIQDPAPSTRMYFLQTFRAVRAIFRRPAFFTVLWIMCGAIACAEFSVYLLQSPLKHFAGQLLERSIAWLPVFTLTMMLGWWASSHGARLFHRFDPMRRASKGHIDTPVFVMFVAPVLALLMMYPTVATAHRSTATSVSIVTLLCLSGVTFVLFQALRGLGTPWARTILVSYAERERLDVPTSIVSVFNAVQKLAHTGFTALFFVVSRMLASDGAASEMQIEFGMLLLGLVLAVGFAVGPMLSYWRSSRSAATARRGSVSVVVIGSFREDLHGLLDYCDKLRQAGVEVLHPPNGATAVREVDGFVQLTTDTSMEPGEQQRRVFEFIDGASAVVLYTPSGRAGNSSAMEIGYAVRTGKPVFATTDLDDATLSELVRSMNGVTPAQFYEMLQTQES